MAAPARDGLYAVAPTEGALWLESKCKDLTISHVLGHQPEDHACPLAAVHLNG